ncbi:MAG: hypothetical protein IPK68_17215 [Bdellovibrionales bacterium]|nr:hypothetical protein [Bdellovibrionales bacterium]
MKSLTTTIAALGLTLAAHATTDIKSEYFYQAAPDANILTPALNYNSNSVKTTATKTDTTGQNLNLAYERGLTEMYAVGANLGYTTSKEDAGATDTDIKGLNDIQIFAKGRYSFVEGSSMNYGAELYFSPSEKQIDSTNNEKDAMSGGNSLRPWVGYQWLMGSHVLGTKVSTDFLLGEKSEKTKSAAAATKYKGGEETKLAVFYEIPHEMGAVGFEAFYAATAETKTGSTVSVNGYNTMGLGVYSPYHFSEAATVIGELKWSQLASSTLGSSAGTLDVDSSSILSLNVAGRFMF